MDIEQFTIEARRVVNSPYHGFGELTKTVADSIFTDLDDMREWAKANGFRVVFVPVAGIYMVFDENSISVTG